ncbi:MAG: protein rep [Candidatus Bathyarchaeota archaeon]|nr:protein rep [Candidatus Bathyarchaeota archaeon]
MESGNRDFDLTGLEEFYLEWRNFDEYIVLQKQTDNLRIKGKVVKETIAIKCSKRGNDVYWWRVWKRLKFLDKLRERTLFNPHANVKIARIVFVTLTFDIKICSIQDAWETIGENFNKWIRNLRKKYGRISYLRGWEASKQGYPHVHLLMFFHDYNFKVIRMKGKYRITEKEGFEKSYHSFIDVQAVQKLKKGIKYITKYLSKYTAESQKLTLALCWLFKKRSFAVSGDFHEILYALIETKHRFIQTDLFRNKLKFEIEWVFIGIFSGSKLEIYHNEWWKVIVTKKKLNEILD